MTPFLLSHTPALHYAANAFATIFIGFGINALIRPAHALSFFELQVSASASPADRNLVDSLLAVYGVRDIFMGLAIYAASVLGTNESLGWTLLAASGIAFADGVVCWSNGKGQWNHWGYAPMIMAVGTVLLGVLDGQ
ncbi:hypothetical protein BX600DRAFT_302368 [Xylariales sp. PMI_506]|nr:hypothetical protein BX600DRAFT_302368 [Xylariales sp. PMI_506]